MTTVVATDADDEANGRVTYRLQRHNDVIPFHLDLQSGKLTVSGKLTLGPSDREFKQYSFDVVATDHGTKPESITQRLNVIVNKSLSLLPSDIKYPSAQNVASRDKSRGSSVIVAVTVSVGSVLLITVILVAMLLRRRRRRHTCNKYSAAVTSSSGTCSNTSPTCLTTSSSSSGPTVLHSSSTIPRSFTSRGQRHSDDVIGQPGQAQGKGEESTMSPPGVDFLFTDCRPLQVYF